jgi:chromatin assembly factor 1 subunit A
MTKFFSKPRAPVNGSNLQNSKFAGPSTIQSDFERVFKPFVLGKDKILAPQNWFHDQRRRRRRAVEALDNGAIVIESEDECDAKMSRPTEGVCAMSREGKSIMDSELINLTYILQNG